MFKHKMATVKIIPTIQEFPKDHTKQFQNIHNSWVKGSKVMSALQLVINV